jgi:FkbM family methyltransferase
MKIIDQLRAARTWYLQRKYGLSGMERMVNGVSLRVCPELRWYFSDKYDKEVAAFFRERVQPGEVCLSIGANLGMYPLQMAHWNGGTGVIYAFEPDPNTSAILRRHIEMNSREQQIHVVEQAVSSQVGTTSFSIAGLTGMSRIGAANPLVQDQAKTISVPVTTIDQFCLDHSVRPSVMMMDIEGFEISAIQGARDFFASSNKLKIVVEMHPNAWEHAGTTKEELIKVLDEYNYKAVPLSGQRDCFSDYGHVSLECRN